MPPEMLTQREDVFISGGRGKGKEREVVKSIKMPESLHRRLKYYALLSERTETDIVAEILRKELDTLNIQLPAAML